MLGFGKIDSVVPLAVSDGLLTFLSSREYKVGKSVKVKLVSLDPEDEVDRPSISVVIGAVEPQREDGSFRCFGNLDVPAKRLPAVMLALAEMGVEGACRRRSARVFSSARILSKDLQNFCAVTQNISATGVQLHCDGPVAPGTYLNLTLDLEVKGLSALVVQVVCIWCSPDPDGRIAKYRLGAALTNQHEQTHEVWEQHYQRLAAKKGTSLMSRTLDGGSVSRSLSQSDSGGFRTPAVGQPPPPPPPAAIPSPSQPAASAVPASPGEPTAPTPTSQPAQPPQPAPYASPQQYSPPAQQYAPPQQQYAPQQYAPPQQQAPPQQYAPPQQQAPPQQYAPQQYAPPQQQAPPHTPPPQQYAPPQQRYTPPVPSAPSTAERASPFYLPPVQPGAASDGFGSAPTNSFLSSLAQTGPPPVAPPPLPPTTAPALVEPLGISGPRLVFRCGPYDSYLPGQHAVVELSLYLEGRDVELPVCIKVDRVENLPNGTCVCWCTVLEDEQKLAVLNQVLATSGGASFLD